MFKSNDELKIKEYVEQIRARKGKYKENRKFIIELEKNNIDNKKNKKEVNDNC